MYVNFTFSSTSRAARKHKIEPFPPPCHVNGFSFRVGRHVSLIFFFLDRQDDEEELYLDFLRRKKTPENTDIFIFRVQKGNFSG